MPSEFLGFPETLNIETVSGVYWQIVKYKLGFFISRGQCTSKLTNQDHRLWRLKMGGGAYISCEWSETKAQTFRYAMFHNGNSDHEPLDLTLKVVIDILNAYLILKSHPRCDFNMWAKYKRNWPTMGSIALPTYWVDSNGSRAKIVLILPVK